MYTLSLHPCRGDIYILPLCPSKCMNSRMRTSDRVHPASTRAWSCAGGSGLQPGLPQSILYTEVPVSPFLCVSYHTIALWQTLQQYPITRNKIQILTTANEALRDPGPGCSRPLCHLLPSSFHSACPALRALPSSAPLPSAHPLPGLLHFLEASAQMSPPQRGLS